MVHCYVCFADVIQIIYCFNRRCVGAYRIRPSCWRCCMYAANVPALFEGHVRPREGVCDTPLQFFGCNHAVMAIHYI